jgi:chemotaxis protein methyltransferase CheR
MLDLITKYALPVLKRHQFVRVWDAGCATGPEPYSIAMILRESMGQLLFKNVLIYATDLDEGNFSDDVALGIYPATKLGSIPRDLFSRYFSPNGKPGYFEVSAELRRAVHFQRHDLLSLQPVRDDLGLIVCKNVLPDLAPTQRVDVIRMFHRALATDGFFIMERSQKMPSETLRLFRQVPCAAQLYRKV